MTKERMSDVRIATMGGAITSMVEFAAKELRIRENEIQDGLRGEELGARGFKSAEKHTNGAREAWRAQQQ